MLSFLVASWRGQERLYKVFWVYGFAIHLVFFAVGVAAGYLGAPAILLPLVPLYLAYSVWLLVSMWRCAGNVDWSGWTYLARIWVGIACVGWGVKLFQVATRISGA